MYITRRERFAAAHRLINHKISDEDNQNLFGKCYNLHGHNYELFVTVCGNVNATSGFIIDLKDLKKIIKDKIIKKLDHNYLNDVDFMKGKLTTTESLCIQIWKELDHPVKLLGAKLYKIKITETENNSFEYFGDNNISYV